MLLGLLAFLVGIPSSTEPPPVGLEAIGQGLAEDFALMLSIPLTLIGFVTTVAGSTLRKPRSHAPATR